MSVHTCVYLSFVCHLICLFVSASTTYDGSGCCACVHHLLNLTDDLTGLGQTLDHLLALLPSADGVLALAEQVVEFVGAVHVVEEFALHFFFGVSGGALASKQLVSAKGADVLDEIQHDGLWNHVDHRSLHNIVVRVDEKF